MILPVEADLSATALLQRRGCVRCVPDRTTPQDQRDVTDLVSPGLPIPAGDWTVGWCLLLVQYIWTFIYWSAGAADQYGLLLCWTVQGQAGTSRTDLLPPIDLRLIAFPVPF